MAVSRGQYYAIKNTLSYTEKEIISYYELQWHLRHHVPTVAEIVKHLNQKHEKEGKNSRVSHTSVNYYLQRTPVVKALDKRGIPWRQHSQSELTEQQVAAAVVMMNFADTRSNDEKLDQLGINSTQYFAWLNDPQFKSLVDSLADQNLVNIKPTAIAEFTKKINQGDWKAIQYFFDVTGAIQNNDAPQSEVLIRMLIEIIQKHVKDPEIIMAIAEDIKLASANRTLETSVQHPQLTGEVVNAEEIDLEYAKKQLGIG